MMLARLANVVALVVMPFLLTGVINRVKSLWSGRRGPPLFQLAYDVVRLLRKSSVYSTTTTPLFRIAPYVLLVTAVGSRHGNQLSSQRGNPAGHARYG
jgi:formate hydrogenlyase subunit 4